MSRSKSSPTHVQCALCQRVVFFSGDVVNGQMREFLEREKRPCLAKPFAFGEIRAAIQKVLVA